MKIRTEARRDAILQIAAAVFLEKGFERASMAEIAQKVGGSKATLYGYFPSKEALFLAVAEAEGQKQMAAAGSELVASGPTALAPALTRFAEALLRFLGAETTCASHRMVIAEAGRSDIGKLFYEIGPKHGLDLIADVLAGAMARKELRQTEPFVAAQHFVALTTSAIQFRLFLRAPEDLTEERVAASAECAVDVFLRAYAADPPRPGRSTPR
ncbi:TetR/AcrR family transcriptional regulator [Rhizobacter sp. Root1221]|uniref:TetR/AcrR family transcriptional regulator n=1 Tax=Rhizobacter sp. Root1221 TaxID=1736433 RepID=UPI0006FCA5E6|nr:TetR/AcrR family transcriptional regulator [Rhizobacter sp. Root1221]KQW00851.1 hypothetical protein ASC87_16725 [Rhizobacter sp. Root1221]